MLIMLAAVVGYNVIILQTYASVLDDYSTALYRTQPLERYAHTLSFSLVFALLRTNTNACHSDGERDGSIHTHYSIYSEMHKSQ